MIAVRVVVEMRYKTEDGFVTLTDETPVGQVRFLYSDNGSKKLGKATIHSNGYNLPKLYSSQSGEVIEKGKTLYFTNGAWTYRLRHMGEAVVA
ncbi:hypothetical protein [Paenibacillus agricola]|uniref:Uncharacterized protein n=1 Tax=Paenibacillus agricola TaxID=2716264 RepID=A0ABX0JCM9_9BACL|nr:hypothetical protein [Paenibacillus agricola]NHN33318.1 hypothetical protein [Paenibacillus agricola]